MPNRQHFTGYILAGGKSSRMKRDKAFLELGATTFLQNAFDALAPNCERVKIVLNSKQKHFIEKLPENFLYLFDIFENRGALGGIHAALQDCQSEWAVILAVDLPFVTGGAIENLQQSAAASNEISAIVPRQTDGRLQPLCAAYRAKDCLPKIEEFLRCKSASAVKDFLKLVPTLFVKSDLISGDENLFFNVNYPSDFQTLG